MRELPYAEDFRDDMGGSEEMKKVLKDYIREALYSRREESLDRLEGAILSKRASDEYVQECLKEFGRSVIAIKEFADWEDEQQTKFGAPLTSR